MKSHQITIAQCFLIIGLVGTWLAFLDRLAAVGFLLPAVLLCTIACFGVGPRGLTRAAIGLAVGACVIAICAAVLNFPFFDVLADDMGAGARTREASHAWFLAALAFGACLIPAVVAYIFAACLPGTRWPYEPLPREYCWRSGLRIAAACIVALLIEVYARRAGLDDRARKATVVYLGCVVGSEVGAIRALSVPWPFWKTLAVLIAGTALALGADYLLRTR